MKLARHLTRICSRTRPGLPHGSRRIAGSQPQPSDESRLFWALLTGINSASRTRSTAVARSSSRPMIAAVHDQAPRAPVGVWEPNKVRSPCWFVQPRRAAEAALGVLGPVGSARCAQTQVSAIRIESSVGPLQLDPKMFSAPADAAVGFSQLPGTLRPSMRALSGIDRDRAGFLACAV